MQMYPDQFDKIGSMPGADRLTKTYLHILTDLETFQFAVVVAILVSFAVFL